MRWGGLFFKYVSLFVGLVTGVLLINGALDLYFVYQDNRRASIDVQREKAEAAAQRIESFVREIERQIGWVAYTQFAALPAEQRRFDYVRLLRQVPAITELAQLDRNGREQLRVSRLSMDVVGSNIDRSTEPAFVEAMANKVYFGPVYFRKESEPYFTMAVVQRRHCGRGEPEADLGCGLEYQDRPHGLCLCRRPAWPAGGASRHLAGATWHRYEQACSGGRGTDATDQ